MSKILFTLLFLFMLGIDNSARADWCHKPNGGIEPCAGIPSTWTDCGKFTDGATIWCYPSGTQSGGHGSSRKDRATQRALISIGVGLAVVWGAWYVFKKLPSKNNPGQISLIEF